MPTISDKQLQSKPWFNTSGQLGQRGQASSKKQNSSSKASDSSECEHEVSDHDDSKPKAPLTAEQREEFKQRSLAADIENNLQMDAAALAAVADEGKQIAQQLATAANMQLTESMVQSACSMLSSTKDFKAFASMFVDNGHVEQCWAETELEID